jgi:hypothetical protein
MRYSPCLDKPSALLKFFLILSFLCMPFFFFAQIVGKEYDKVVNVISLDTVRLPNGKPLPPPKDNRNTPSTISARSMVCPGTTTINGCNGSITINNSCLQPNQYFVYDHYSNVNLACFARTDQNCNITTEGWAMCLNYPKHGPQSTNCYSTYTRSNDLACAGINSLQASQILWMMSNAAAWGLDVSTLAGKEALNEAIWGITDNQDWPCNAGGICAASKSNVTTPYTNIECRVTVLCPNDNTEQALVIFSGIGGNALSSGGAVSPNQTICLGQNSVPTTPSVSAYVGSVVRWEYAAPGGAWVNWGGAGSATAPSNCCFSSVGVWKVRAIIQNGICPEVASNEAWITVNPAPTLPTQPVGFTECIGGTQTLSVVGNSVTSYQWQSSLDGITWTNIGGATTATYTPLSTTSGTTRYRVIVDNPVCAALTSNPVSVIIVNKPTVNAISPIPSVCVNGIITVTSTQSGGASTCSLQWQSSPNGTTWTNIAGATGNTFSTPNLNTTTHYRVQLVSCAGNGCCN